MFEIVRKTEFWIGVVVGAVIFYLLKSKGYI